MKIIYYETYIKVGTLMTFCHFIVRITFTLEENHRLFFVHKNFNLKSNLNL